MWKSPRNINTVRRYCIAEQNSMYSMHQIKKIEFLVLVTNEDVFFCLSISFCDMTDCERSKQLHLDQSRAIITCQMLVSISVSRQVEEGRGFAVRCWEISLSSFYNISPIKACLNKHRLHPSSLYFSLFFFFF